MARDGKLVIRPDSGDPVDIICGTASYADQYEIGEKGVVQLLWDVFGGSINNQGYKVLDSHIGCIYGDSINLERQISIYERLENKGFSCTNIVLGIGSFTYQMNTRDTLGFAAKGAWFECDGKGYDIYKDPITDDGTKKSLKGLQKVYIEDGEYKVKSECTWNEEKTGELNTIYKNGKFFNQTTFKEIRNKINNLL